MYKLTLSFVNIKLLCIGIIFYALSATAVLAQTATNGNGTDWHTSANWDNGVPSAGVTVTINHPMTISSAAASAGAITINNTDFDITNGRTLTADAITLNATSTTKATFSMSDGTGTASTANISGDFIANQNTFSNVACRIDVDETSVLNITGDLTYTRLLTTFSGEGNTEISVGSTVGSTAELEIGGDCNLIFNADEPGILLATITEDATFKATNLNITSSDNVDPADGISGVNFEILKNAQASITKINLTYNAPVSAYNQLHEIRINIDDSGALKTDAIDMTSNIAGASANYNNLIRTLDANATLTITGDITFVSNTTSTENRIQGVNGEIILHGDITNLNQGSFEFLNNSTFELAGSGIQSQTLPKLRSNTYYQNLVFNNTSSVNIATHEIVRVNQSLTLTDGIVTTDATKPFLFRATATNTGGRPISFIDGPVIREGAATNVDFIFPVGDGTFFAPAELTNITASDATSQIQVEYSETTPTNNTSLNPGLTLISGREHWSIAATGTTIPSSDIALYWEDACLSEIEDIISVDLVMAGYDGANWSDLGSTSITNSFANTAAASCVEGGAAETGSITHTAVDLNTYTEFTFGSILANNPLPLDFIDFIATPLAYGAFLEWETANEYNCDYFSIERANSTLVFGEIARVPAKNSSELNYYSHTDALSENGSFYYRLRQVDFNGDFTYSKTILVRQKGSDNVREMKIFPNPLNVSSGADLVIKSGLFGSDSYQIQLINSIGAEVFVKRVVPTSNKLQISNEDISQLNTGHYTLILSAFDREPFYSSIVISK